MNINALYRAIEQRKLHPDFPIFAVNNKDEKFKVFAFMIDAEKCCLFIEPTPNKASLDLPAKILDTSGD